MIAVFFKETIILLRSRKAFWLMLATVLLAGLILGLQWVSLAQFGGFINQRASLGRSFFMFLSVAQLCMMGLISPMMSATAVTNEREANTFDLLISTRLSRLRLLLGKWLATIAFQIVIAFCLLPVLALVFQLGGVDTDEYLFAAVMIVLTVMTYGMLGLAFSCKARKSNSALVATLLTVLLLTIGFPIFMLIGTGGATGSSHGMAEYCIYSISPLMTWIEHLSRLGTYGSATVGRTSISFFHDPYFIVHLVFQALLFLFALHVARRRLIRPELAAAFSPDDTLPGAPTPLEPAPPALPVPALPAAAAPMADGPEEPPPDEAPARPIPRRLIQVQEIRDDQDPVLVKEFNSWMDGRSNGTMTLLMMIFVLVSLILVIPAASLASKEYVQVLGASMIPLLFLALPIFAAPAISREREANTMDQLLAIPFTPRQIVYAKFFALQRLSLLLLLPLAALPFFVRMTIIFANGNPEIMGTRLPGLIQDLFLPTVMFVLPVIAFASLAIAIGLYFSSGQRRGMTALLQTYLGIGALCFLPIPILAFIGAFQFSSRAEPVRLLGQFCLPFLNPFYYFFDEDHMSVLTFNGSRSPIASLFWMGVHLGIVSGLVLALLRAAARRMVREKD